MVEKSKTAKLSQNCIWDSFAEHNRTKITTDATLEVLNKPLDAVKPFYG
jgi:hypothetical protein